MAPKLWKLKILALTVLVGFLAAIAYNHACFHYFGQPLYPQCTFLFRPFDALGDIYGIVGFNKNLDPFHNVFRTYEINYPPFAYLLMAPFTNGFDWPTSAFVYAAFSAIGFWIFVGWACRTERSEDPHRLGWLAAIVLGTMTYPFLFAMDRLNTENVIFLLMAAGYVAEVSLRQRRWSPIIWGLAGATKVYPGFYGLIYIPERRWKDLAKQTIVVLAATALSLVVFQVGPREALDAYARAMPNFKRMTLDPTNMQHTVSLFGVLRLFQVWIYGAEFTFDKLTVDDLVSIYRWIALPVLAIYLATTLKPSVLKRWESLLLITAMLLLVPQTSFDYKLLHLFIPLAAFLADAETPRRQAFWYSLGFGLLLIPKHYWVFYREANLNVLLNPLLLIGMSIPLFLKAWSPKWKK